MREAPLFHFTRGAWRDVLRSAMGDRAALLHTEGGNYYLNSLVVLDPAGKPSSDGILHPNGMIVIVGDGFEELIYLNPKGKGIEAVRCLDVPDR